MKFLAVPALVALLFVFTTDARGQARDPKSAPPSDPEKKSTPPTTTEKIPGLLPAPEKKLAPILDDRRTSPPPAPPEKRPDTPGMIDKLPKPLPANEQKPTLPPPATLPPPPAPATPRSAVDALTDAELDEVISLLKENFINPGALSEFEMKRAGVQGLIARIAPGVAILQAPAPGARTSSPFRAEILDGRVGYLRLGSASPENVRELDAALQKFSEKKLGAVVLDLRATPPSSDFEETAEVCRRFCPKGKVLFSVRKPNVKQEQILTSKEEPKFRGNVVVLIDGDTAGNAEVIAAVLRAHVFAMVFGQQTKGEAVEFAELPLQSGKLLRVAVAEVSLPQSMPVFPGGVKPDVAVEVPQATTDLLLKQELEKGVAEFVLETERPRLNEAALVAGANPELDAMQLAQKNKGEKPKPPPLRDAVLQRAMDFITTVSFWRKS